MYKDREKINRRVAVNRVKTNIATLMKSTHTFESIFNISFSKDKYILFEQATYSGINKITYLEGKENVNKYACYFYNNISKDTHYVGLYLENSPKWIYCFYGLLKSGFVPVLLSTAAQDVEINKIINKLDIKYIVSNKKFNNVNNILLEDIISFDNLNKKEINNWENEIVFMTSGVSNDPKLVLYTGEEITNQISTSFNILKTNYQFASTYKKLFKHLVILPFYHIFGLIAVFIWFAFFNVTFVFPIDLKPNSIRQACLLSGVTHIFAVPLFWDTIAKQINFEVAKQKKEEKFNKFIDLSIKIQKLFPKKGPKFIRKVLFKKYLEKIFGPSISFCISGGGNISYDTLRIINGLGYPLMNGYGATEIGIVSLENSNKIMNRISGSIGYPLGDISFNLKVNNNVSNLFVKGNSTANKIMIKNTWEEYKDKEIDTNDIVIKKDNGYFINGRVDNLYVSNNGENYSLELLENNINLTYCKSYSLIIEKDNSLACILSYPNNYIELEINKDLSLLKENKSLIKLVKKIYITNRSIPLSNGIKIKRRQLVNDFYKFSNEFKLIDLSKFKFSNKSIKHNIPKDIVDKILKVYSKYFPNKNVNVDSNYYMDLNGDSLSYFLLVGDLEKEFNITLEIKDNIPLTPLDFANLIKRILNL